MGIVENTCNTRWKMMVVGHWSLVGGENMEKVQQIRCIQIGKPQIENGVSPNKKVRVI